MTHQLSTFASPAEITMTSIEMVKYLNDERKNSPTAYAQVEHSDFMKRVPKVLGEGVGKFSDTYIHPQNWQTYPSYTFPKREACLMAMSYSYELQAKVFDKMTALEVALKNAPVHYIPQTYKEAMLLAIENHEKFEQAKTQMALDAPKVAVYTKLIADKGVSIAALAKMLPGVNSNKTKSDLMGLGYLHKNSGHYGIYSKYRDVLFEHGVEDSFGNHEIYVLAKGKELLTELHATRQLTMKVGF